MDTVAELQAKIDALEQKKKQVMDAEQKMIGGLVQFAFKKELAGKNKGEVKAFVHALRVMYDQMAAKSVVSGTETVSDEKSVLHTGMPKPVVPASVSE